MLPDATELVKLLKKTALDAVAASKPCNVMFGKVTSISPLKINVEQKMILSEKQLVLSRSVTNFKEKISMYSTDGWMTDQGQTINRAECYITIHNGLVVGDKVILIRQQGGQKFVVLDRVET